MLLLGRESGAVSDSAFTAFVDLLHGDELLVFNNARVVPARLYGKREGRHSQRPAKSTVREHLTGAVEVMLLREVESDVWEALVRPGRKLPVGERITFGAGELHAEILSRGELGMRTLRLISHDANSPKIHLDRLGHIPLPPYIEREDDVSDRERYQTVFAKNPGAVAAPTAGLHFSQQTLAQIRAKKIATCEITLNVGLGTFQPIHAENLENHVMHTESYEIGEDAAAEIAAARRARRRILAVGTTVVRALEDAAVRAGKTHSDKLLQAGRSEASIFITPGYRFRVVDALLTNFHLPRSTLLALVCAFAGKQNTLAAYEHAVRASYRFYSYGDCMLIR